MKHLTRPRLFLMLTLLVAACSGGPELASIRFEKTLLPNRLYTVNALTESSSGIDIERMPGMEGLISEKHSATARSRQLLTTGPLFEGAIPLRLETMDYDGTDDSLEMHFNLAGVYGNARFDSSSKQISLLDLQGECQDTLLSLQDVGDFLVSAYQAIQGALLDTVRQFSVGQSDTVSGVQLHPMGPLNMSLKEISVYTLDRIQGDSAWFSVKRWAELQDDEMVTSLNTTVEGTGSGSMLYLMSENYVVQTSLSTSLTVSHTTDSLAFVATSGSRIDVTTTIEPSQP
ncbi:MAG: hypothetical protein KC518_05280 [Candidatus Cloacimonetes bacterium]|nr:hypothetical protein [Candidatus Cloacimonadota bacterium]